MSKPHSSMLKFTVFVKQTFVNRYICIFFISRPGEIGVKSLWRKSIPLAASTLVSI